MCHMLLIALFFCQLLQLGTSTGHLYQHLKDNIRTVGHVEAAFVTNGTTDTDSGYLMCAGNHMVPDALKMIWQLKYQWNSTYGVAVAHCGEISSENQEVLQIMHPGVRVLNMCESSVVLGMKLSSAHYRLRGFYCKVAAMILSPFQNTMLLDLDVVWFSSPDLVFKSKAYQNTGALFFRDRTYPANKNHKNDDNVLLDLFHSRSIGRSLEDMKRQVHPNGFSFYWQFLVSKNDTKPFPQFGDLQDSSVVVLNRNKHPRMLRVLEELLPTFDYGYGDKEIFWVSATLAEEPFTMSPFLAGQYGDCHGVILHYNPDDVDRPDTAQPLYTNAEYFVEKDVNTVGDFMSKLRTPPRLAESVLDVGTDMNTWPSNTGKRGSEGCTCRVYPCVPATDKINKYMSYAQWVTLTMRLARAGPASDCVPVHVAAYHHLHTAMSTVKPEHCFFVGCPHFPLELNTTLLWPTGRYCDPVHFRPIPPAEMDDLAAEARRPNSAYNTPPAKDNTPIQCESDKQLMLYVNGTGRPFDSWNAFVSRGFDLDNVVRLTRWQCASVPIGEALN